MGPGTSPQTGRGGAIMSDQTGCRRLSGPDPDRILVYRIGQLGDTIVALPALWDLRRRFPTARLDLLYNVDGVGNTVDARSLLEPTGIFAGYLPYRIATGPTPLRQMRACANALAVLRAVRHGRYEALAYLAPTARNDRDRQRDARFFRACRLRHMWGTDAPGIPENDPASGLGEADLLRRQLGFASGPPCLDLRIGTTERQRARDLLAGIPVHRTLLAIAPAAAMPAKLWPVERYLAVCAILAERHDIHLLVLGGPADRALAARFTAALPGRCHDLCGQAPPRVTVALLERCRMLLANDSGNLHLGACAKVPSVGVFAARNHPGRWHPLNPNATILRLDVPCVGCGHRICPLPEHPCLNGISTDMVLAAVERCLTSQPVASL